jgi:hypothetical protein
VPKNALRGSFLINGISEVFRDEILGAVCPGQLGLSILVNDCHLSDSIHGKTFIKSHLRWNRSINQAVIFESLSEDFGYPPGTDRGDFC